jgi:hypothetical protein
VTITACATAPSENAVPYPASRSNLDMGVVNSRSSVPLARSRRIVMAAMGNITAHGMTAI